MRQAISEKARLPLSKDTLPKPANPPAREIPPAAQRAFAEAEERRKKAAEAAASRPPLPKEINGPKGPEPTRYGDWEKKGIASDF
jgi:hypothetical protein